MPQLPSKDLGNFIDAYLTRKYERLIGARFFQGTVAGVIGSGVPYQITLTRVGESQQDGNTYQVMAIGYVPTIGDRVECFWRDPFTAYCLGPVSRVVEQAGTATVVVPNASRFGNVTGVTFPAPYPVGVVPRVLTTGQNSNALAAAEEPWSCHVYSVTNAGFNIDLVLTAAAAAQRSLNIGWVAIG